MGGIWTPKALSLWCLCIILVSFAPFSLKLAACTACRKWTSEKTTVQLRFKFKDAGMALPLKEFSTTSTPSPWVAWNNRPGHQRFKKFPWIWEKDSGIPNLNLKFGMPFCYFCTNFPQLTHDFTVGFFQKCTQPTPGMVQLTSRMPSSNSETFRLWKVNAPSFRRSARFSLQPRLPNPPRLVPFPTLSGERWPLI